MCSLPVPPVERVAGAHPLHTCQPLRPTLPVLNAPNPCTPSHGSVTRSYRRLDTWLAHGLSPDTTPDQLAANIFFCEVDPNGAPHCIKQPDGSTSLPFTAALQGPGVLRLSVPGLQEGRKYRVRVQANAGVKDGYGQGLQVSREQYLHSSVAPPCRHGRPFA